MICVLYAILARTENLHFVVNGWFMRRRSCVFLECATHTVPISANLPNTHERLTSDSHATREWLASDSRVSRECSATSLACFWRFTLECHLLVYMRCCNKLIGINSRNSVSYCKRGATAIVIFTGILTSTQYCDILEASLVPFIKGNLSQWASFSTRQQSQAHQ